MNNNDTFDNITLIKKLYCHLDMNDRTLDDVIHDASIDYLGEYTGRDGNDYFWYLSNEDNAAIRYDGKIVDDEKTIADLFC